MGKTEVPKSKTEIKKEATEIVKINNSRATFQDHKSEQISGVLNKYSQSLSDLLTDNKRVSRVIQVMASVIKRNPDLQKCTQSSMISGMLQFATLNLDPDPTLGHAYLVPYKNKYYGDYDAQFQLGYRGMVQLAQRSGEIVDIYANVVYEGDDFIVEYGLNRSLKHIPVYIKAIQEDRQDKKQGLSDKNIIFAYAVAKTKSGGTYFSILTKNQIENLRLRSPMQKAEYLSGAWKTDYAEMAKAKALKQLAKLLPMSTDVERSVFTDGIVLEKYDSKTNYIESYDPEYDALEVNTDTGEIIEAEEIAEVKEDVKETQKNVNNNEYEDFPSYEEIFNGGGQK